MPRGIRPWVLGVVGVVVLSGLGGGCGRITGGSACGVPYALKIGSKTSTLGNCAGDPVYGLVPLSLAVGKTLTVGSATNADGSLAATPPSTSDPAVLALVAKRGATEVFRAERPGTAKLVVGGAGASCVGKPTTALPCWIAEVHVSG